MKKIFYSFVLFFVWIKPCDAQVIAQDSLAVYDFYYENIGRIPAGPVTTWFPGIVVTGDRITSISFEGFTYMGMGPATIRLPSSFGNLTALKKLFLKGGPNFGFGGFPASCVNLTALEEISFYSLEVSFPDNSPLFSMPWIKKLSVFGAREVILPSAISRITGLEYLVLAGSTWNGVSLPLSLGDCSNLEYIDVSYNQFPVGVFPGIGRLTKLKYYNAGGGGYPENAGTIPDSIGYCTELRVLNLNGGGTL